MPLLKPSINMIQPTLLDPTHYDPEADPHVSLSPRTQQTRWSPPHPLRLLRSSLSPPSPFFFSLSSFTPNRSRNPRSNEIVLISKNQPTKLIKSIAHALLSSSSISFFHCRLLRVISMLFLPFFIKFNLGLKGLWLFGWKSVRFRLKRNFGYEFAVKSYC